MRQTRRYMAGIALAALLAGAGCSPSAGRDGASSSKGLAAQSAKAERAGDINRLPAEVRADLQLAHQIAAGAVAKADKELDRKPALGPEQPTQRLAPKGEAASYETALRRLLPELRQAAAKAADSVEP